MKNFLRVCLLFVFASVLVGTSWAQERSVSGKVTALDDGSPLPGVNVVIKGTSSGTITDVDGNYSISVSDGAVLVFSFIGYTSEEVDVGVRSVVDLKMSSDVTQLGEVVVVAYGEQSRKELTGSISTVSADEISRQAVVSPIRAIQGIAPGVNILTTGGQPGENPTIRIRGIGSVNAEKQPLVVVDGVVFSGSLNAISGDQIQTINVLKDASAAALYGSRAANGVILITTKGGNIGKRETRINLSTIAGYSSPAVDTYELVGAEKGMQYFWEALKHKKQFDARSPLPEDQARQWATDNLISELKYNPYGTISKPIGTDGKPVSGAKLLWDTDWEKALIRDKAFYNEVTLSAEGGSENMSYFISANRLVKEGGVIESDFERYSGRVNLQMQLTDWLTMGTNNSFSKSSQNYPNQAGSSYTNTMQWINNVSSIYPIYERDENGKLKKDLSGNLIFDYGSNSKQTINGARSQFENENTVGSAFNHDKLNKRTSLFSSTFMKIDIYKGISIKSTVGYERYIFDQNHYYHHSLGHAASVKGRVDQEKNITESITFTNLLNYQKQFDEHKISVDLISEVFEYDYERFGARGVGFLPGVKVQSGAAKPEVVLGYNYPEKLVSYMGRVNYGFKGKYFIDASLRRDASTRFRDGKRWGNFYSLGGSWLVSEEDFLENLSNSISLFKLRASYGELGNNRLINNYFPYLSAFAVGWSNNDNIGILKDGRADRDISWEKSALFSVGLDFGLFTNRLTGTIEYYNKKSVDLIFDKPVAKSTGDRKVTTNIGDMTNSGFELTLKSVNVMKKDIEWTTSINIATNKNELTRLPQDEIIIGTKKLRVGKSIYDFFMQEYAGVDPKTGDALWYMDTGKPKKDSEGKIMKDNEGRIIYENYKKETTNDYSKASRYYHGSSLPDFYGGFSTFFRYKDFDLNVLFNYSFGGKIFDGSYQGLMGSLERNGQLSVDIADRWQKPGDVTSVPKLLNANNDYNSTSTRFLFDNDYIRLKSVTLGYNFPTSLISKISLFSARIYVQADNMWTYQSHKGLDPEQNFAGTTNDRSNLLKTFSIGLNVGL